MKNRLGKMFRTPVLLGALVAAGFVAGFANDAAAEEDAASIPGPGIGSVEVSGTAFPRFDSDGMFHGYLCANFRCNNTYCCYLIVRQ
ncbi:MAG: hypothetical protein ICV87_01205 [Gemmatimonadetes bacterium]|nr:hypothetical protein [Gemmatimonadota bacterium]